MRISRRWAVMMLLGLLAVPASAAEKGAPVKVCLVSASAEYQSEESLAGLQKHLEENFNAACFRAFGTDKGNDIPGLEALAGSDVMVLFTRRVTLSPEQMKLLRDYVDAGKPVIGIRTASHGIQNWQPETMAFDSQVLGGSYKGHYKNNEPAQVVFASGAEGSPLLESVKPFGTEGKLYKNPELAKDAVVLLTATNQSGNTEPVAWTRVHKGGRIFYTSLGVPADFARPDFQRLLVNAVFWTANRKVEAK